jgi:hypothetical protein
MTTRQPLVLGPDGKIQQLQAGDAISSSVSTYSVRSMTNADSVSLPFGTPVYTSASDSVKRAVASAAATSIVSGLVYDPTIAAAAAGNIADSGTLVGTTAQWDAVVTGETGGLVFNGLYFLDPVTPGKLTLTPPTTVGQSNVLVGQAFSATELKLLLMPPILL